MNIKSGAEGLRDVMDQILKQIVAQLIRVFVVQKAVAAVIKLKKIARFTLIPA